MPDVQIYYTRRTALNYTGIAAVLNREVPRHLPLNGRALDPTTEISIRFVERHPFDQVTHDIEVCISAHLTEERAADADGIARAIRTALSDVMPDVNLSVGIQFSIVGYSDSLYGNSHASTSA